MRGAVLLLFLLGCGGRAASHGEEQTPEAVAGSTTTTSPPLGGAGGTLSVTVPDLPAPELCDPPAPSCHLEGTYVEIDDEPGTRLLFQYDSICPSCWVPCEDCSSECELSATGVSRCGVVSLRLAACAGADHAPPCLDTTADEPHFVDADGKNWSAALKGRASTEAGPTPLDADFTLYLTDGSTTRELAAHVRVCADVNTTLVPCK